MYLLDTNIWLERLLNQEKSPQVEKFLYQTPSELLWMTDFSLHSIAIILVRLRKSNLLIKFIDDLFINGAVNLIRLGAKAFHDVINDAETYGLDFDDAYQVTATKKQGLILVSFDRDLDRAPIGRKTPAELLG